MTVGKGNFVCMQRNVFISLQMYREAIVQGTTISHRLSGLSYSDVEKGVEMGERERRGTKENLKVKQVLSFLNEV